MNSEIAFDEFGPEKVLEVYDRISGMRGFLVIDNTARGPGKGGIRISPSVSVSEVARLARTMTWKCALAGLPFGGAKSGIVADTKQTSRERKKEIIQAFSRAIKLLCPKLYIAAPDMNTGEEEMRWFVEANGSWNAATGKPKDMCKKYGEACGIPHEYGSTGFGVAHSAAAACSSLSMEIKGASAAIEGFGNVGSFAAKYLADMDAKIVAVSDTKGVAYNPDGLVVNKLLKIKRETGSVINYREAEILPPGKIFELPVDILIPAAQPDAITKANAGKVRAKIIIEGANIPMRHEIEEVLHRRGILVVPDIVANAGGVVSSYAEYKGYHPKDMFALVERKIRKNIRIVLARAKEKNMKPRDAALEIAMERVRKDMEKIC